LLRAPFEGTRGHAARTRLLGIDEAESPETNPVEKVRA